MLFNSFEFLLVFLPITIALYYFLQYQSWDQAAKGWLLVASLIFYSWWKIEYLPIIITSVIVNYYLGRSIVQTANAKLKLRLLVIGVVCNVSCIGYFKYFDFFLENINALTSSPFDLLEIALPLGISFFTFQQIAYLVDSYRGLTKEYNFVNYGVFVTFFPQLIAGPIVHHGDMIPQFMDETKSKIDWGNLSKGVFVFFAGLCKKIIIADSFAVVANAGYANPELLNGWQSWVTSFAYSAQLYFDFSGYSDMAIGLGLLFNIKIPLNFNSPYKAVNIQEFWRRWHITLSKFLRDYIYIPLGGNKAGDFSTYKNLLLTFIIGGIWHGAGWTFIFWGFLHGFALILHRKFQQLKIEIPSFISVLITFLFVNMAWVFFRAENWGDAVMILKKMTFLIDSDSNFELIGDFYAGYAWIIGTVLLCCKNTNELAEEFTFGWKYTLYTVILVLAGIIYLNSTMSQDFLYFDF
jgi:D-alanyl-lipoteichoic acid acyltransferase DltB (MBOAT superfamily)